MYGATGFVAMNAAAETAFLRKHEEFAETVRDIGLVLVVESQRFNARRIDQASAEIQFEHFRKRGGMLALAGIIADLAGAQFQLVLNGIDEAAFPYARLSAYQSGFTFQEVFKCLKTSVLHNGSQ